MAHDPQAPGDPTAIIHSDSPADTRVQAAVDAYEMSTPISVIQQAIVIDVIDDPAFVISSNEYQSYMHWEVDSSLADEPDDAELQPVYECKFNEGQKLTKEQQSALEKEGQLSPGVKTVRKIDSAPRNSIIAKIISSGKNIVDDTVHVCLPFFPPHIAMPVKPGEKVWVIAENPTNPSSGYYWMCRISEPDFVDDVNHTHGDRKFADGPLAVSTKPASPGTVDDARGTATATKFQLPGFPNGVSNTPGEAGEIQTLNLQHEFEQIDSSALSNSRIVNEPVPRFTKRPGDLVLQGSNNSLICLGIDRGSTSDVRPEKAQQISNIHSGSAKSFAGAIDIVVGRGRIINSDTKTKKFQLPNPTDNDTEGDVPAGTSPRTIYNKRGMAETDKNPNTNFKVVGDHNRCDNPSEGDPDFINDLSRVHISMSTSGDHNFGLNYPLVPEAKDEATAGVEVKKVNDAPYVTVKSNEIRIIARQTKFEGNVVENGSIKIIKEGTPDDEEKGEARAVIIMQPDGTIMIDGPKVVIGSGVTAANKENGKGQQVILGLGATEPIVLGNTLISKLEAYMDAVSAAFLFASTHVHATGVGPSGPPTGDQWAGKKTAVDTTKGELKEILSKIGKTL